jgi:hypothetical protein
MLNLSKLRGEGKDEGFRGQAPDLFAEAETRTRSISWPSGHKPPFDRTAHLSFT